ncbi:unnamed protein product, partial [Mesorhabditis spiculigera]
MELSLVNSWYDTNEDAMSQTTVQEVVLETNVDVDRQSLTEVEVNGYVDKHGHVLVNGGTPLEKVPEVDVVSQLRLLRNFILNLPLFIRDESKKLVATASERFADVRSYIKCNEAFLKDMMVKTVAIVLAVSALFSFVIAYRVGKTFYAIEDTYICRGLTSVDSVLGTSLGPTLCATFHDDVYAEAQHEATALLGEIRTGITSVLADIIKGLTVMVRLALAISDHLFGALYDGLYELWDNMTDNLSFLVDFLAGVYHFLIRIFLAGVDPVVAVFWSACAAAKSIFVREETGWFS